MNELILKMIQKSVNAMQNAHAPYSNFHVGCCLITENEKMFVGANVENAAYPSTLCAESVAVGSMIAAGERQIKEIVVVSSGSQFCAPCGNCRQILSEFATNSTMIHMHHEGELKSIAFADLLPAQFELEKK